MKIVVKAGSVEISIEETNQEDRVTSLKWEDQKNRAQEVISHCVDKCKILIDAQNAQNPNVN